MESSQSSAVAIDDLELDRKLHYPSSLSLASPRLSSPNALPNLAVGTLGRRLGPRSHLAGVREDEAEQLDLAEAREGASRVRCHPLITVVPAVALPEPCFVFRRTSGKPPPSNSERHRFMVVGVRLNIDP